MHGNDQTDSRLEMLRYVSFDSELGCFLLVRSEQGLSSVMFSKELDIDRELSRIRGATRILAVEDRLHLRRVVDDIRSYLAGVSVDFDYELDLSTQTEFSRTVLETVRGIPFGTLRSYKWVAEEIGSPRATRPVGQTLARNPLPIVIPCHRVVNSDGSLGGYSSGGTDMKRRLIEIENGQTGLAFQHSAEEGRRRIRFLLESEGGEGDATA
jgi:O-6-methylguanine DNA methyltransferase